MCVQHRYCPFWYLSMPHHHRHSIGIIWMSVGHWYLASLYYISAFFFLINLHKWGWRRLWTAYRRRASFLSPFSSSSYMYYSNRRARDSMNHIISTLSLSLLYSLSAVCAACYISFPQRPCSSSHVSSLCGRSVCWLYMLGPYRAADILRRIWLYSISRWMSSSSSPGQ